MPCEDPGDRRAPTAPGGPDLFEPIFTSDAVAAATGPAAWLAALLRFERELARAEADAGVVPAEAAEAVAAAADALRVAPGDLAEGARAAGNPVVPLVRALTAAVDAAAGPALGAWVHFGATSQDALDTAAMLVAKEACRLILADAGAAAEAGAALAQAHRTTVMAARTLLQQALPTTFGLKAAGWVVGLCEAEAALERVATGRLAVQLGGAAGTLASLGARGPAVSALLADRLGLADPVMPWHTGRGRVGELAGALAGLANAGAKVALDVVLLAQTEVGEVAEGGGGAHGGSSTLPHKANPATSVAVLAAARRAHAAAGALVASGVHDHERSGTGAWHAEWPSLTDLLRATGGCADGARRVLEGLAVDGDRMAANLAQSHGVLVAERVALDLAPDLGKARAAEIVRQASRRALAEASTLRQALADVAEVTAHRNPAALDELCRVDGYLGAADVLVDRALALHDARREAVPGTAVKAAGGAAGRRGRRGSQGPQGPRGSQGPPPRRRSTEEEGSP